MSWLLTLQDGKGGFDFVGNPFKITGAVGDVDDLKKVLNSNRILFILLWNIFRRDVTKIEHSKHFCNPCCKFMVCIHVQYCAVTFKLGALTKPI